MTFSQVPSKLTWRVNQNMANIKHLNEKKHVGNTLRCFVGVSSFLCPLAEYNLRTPPPLPPPPHHKASIPFLLKKATNGWSTDFYCNIYLKKELWWLEATLYNVCMCPLFSKIMKRRGLDHMTRTDNHSPLTATSTTSQHLLVGG